MVNTPPQRHPQRKMPGANWMGGKRNVARNRSKDINTASNPHKQKEHFARIGLSASHRLDLSSKGLSRGPGPSVPVKKPTFDFAHAKRDVQSKGLWDEHEDSASGRLRFPKNPTTPRKSEMLKILEKSEPFDTKKRRVQDSEDLSGLAYSKRRRAESEYTSTQNPPIMLSPRRTSSLITSPAEPEEPDQSFFTSPITPCTPAKPGSSHIKTAHLPQGQAWRDTMPSPTYRSNHALGLSSGLSLSLAPLTPINRRQPDPYGSNQPIGLGYRMSPLGSPCEVHQQRVPILSFSDTYPEGLSPPRCASPQPPQSYQNFSFPSEKPFYGLVYAHAQPEESHLDAWQVYGARLGYNVPSADGINSSLPEQLIPPYIGERAGVDYRLPLMHFASQSSNMQITHHSPDPADVPLVENSKSFTPSLQLVSALSLSPEQVNRTSQEPPVPRTRCQNGNADFNEQELEGWQCVPSHDWRQESYSSTSRAALELLSRELAEGAKNVDIGGGAGFGSPGDYRGCTPTSQRTLQTVTSILYHGQDDIAALLSPPKRGEHVQEYFRSPGSHAPGLADALHNQQMEPQDLEQDIDLHAILDGIAVRNKIQLRSPHANGYASGLASVDTSSARGEMGALEVTGEGRDRTQRWVGKSRSSPCGGVLSAGPFTEGCNVGAGKIGETMNEVTTEGKDMLPVGQNGGVNEPQDRLLGPCLFNNGVESDEDYGY